MRPIPAPRIGDSHGILRAIEDRGRLRTDELVTEFSLEQLFPPDMENAVGRMRHFISYARSAGLVKEDRGVVELTEVGKRYVRAGDADAPFDVSEQQAEWLRRQLREKHMTDSIFHGMAIGLSLLASTPPGSRVSTLDFGRALAYLGRAGWDNENTFQIQGERYLTLLIDVELIDGEHRLTATGEQVRGELTLPVHMSLLDIAAQLNPGGADAVRAEGDAEWAAQPAEAAVEAEAEEPSESGYHDVVPGSYAPSASNGEGALPAATESAPEPPASQGPPVPPDDIWETAAPDDTTKAIPAAHPPVVPRASDPATPKAPAPGEMTSGDPLADTPTVVALPAGAAAAAGGETAAAAGEVAAGDAPGAGAGDVSAAADAAGAPPSGDPAGAMAPGDAPLGGAVAGAASLAGLGGAVSSGPPDADAAAAASPAPADIAAAGREAAAGASPADIAAAGREAAAGTSPADIAAAGREAAAGAGSADVAAGGVAPADIAAAAAGASPADIAAAGASPADIAAAGRAAAAGAAPADIAAAGGASPADIAASAAAAAAGAAPAGLAAAGRAAAAGTSPADIAAAGRAAAAGASPADIAAAAGAAPADVAAAAGVSPTDIAAAGRAAAAGAAPADLAAAGRAAAAGAAPADLAAAGRAAAAGAAPADLAAAAGAVPADLAGGAVAAPGGDIAALGRAALAGELRGDAAAFVDPAAIRAAAEGAGLRFPDAVYANLAAALGAGKHVLLTGAAGAGKTSLALAVARAAAQAGKANGATLVTGRRGWDDQGVLVESAKRGRWVIFDELDRADLDDALGELSSFLAGLPVLLAGGDEAAPEGGWRVVATAARVPNASAALMRRFAVVEVLPPAGDVLVAALNVAARGDATAAAAAARLIPLAEIAPLGAGVFIDAARHAAARQAAAPADEATLARDAFAAYVAPLLGDLDAAAERRVREILGDA